MVAFSMLGQYHPSRLVLTLAWACSRRWLPLSRRLVVAVASTLVLIPARGRSCSRPGQCHCGHKWHGPSAAGLGRHRQAQWPRVARRATPAASVPLWHFSGPRVQCPSLETQTQGPLSALKLRSELPLLFATSFETHTLARTGHPLRRLRVVAYRSTGREYMWHMCLDRVHRGECRRPHRPTNSLCRPPMPCQDEDAT